jgi:poly-gamma-glutamate capsule biosynthesis protein CapA/YwtB (metallophosphatase superfamily)
MPSGNAPAIGLLGDVMLGRMVAAALQDRSPEALWASELGELAGSLDLVICNLECCVSGRGTPTNLIEGKPFFFRGPPAAVDALKAMSIRAVGLANNHILDFGEEALQDTLDLLHVARIATAGAGFGVEASRAPAVVRAGDLRVGLVAVADHPAEYAAAPGHWGVAYASLSDRPPPWLLETIRATRERCDLVIAFPHWGPNMATRPAAWQQRAAADLHAAGADLVAGHSAHVFHGVGWHRGPTLFDLGDVLDDYMVHADLRNDLGVFAIWHPSADPQLELVGLRLEHCHTRLAQAGDADWIAARLERACRELGTAVTRTGERHFTICFESSSNPRLDR